MSQPFRTPILTGPLGLGGLMREEVGGPTGRWGGILVQSES